jgi:hypothetical protein
MVIMPIVVDVFGGVLALPLSIGSLLLTGSLSFRALILTFSLPVGSSILAVRAHVASVSRPLGTCILPSLPGVRTSLGSLGTLGLALGSHIRALSGLSRKA